MNEKELRLIYVMKSILKDKFGLFKNEHFVGAKEFDEKIWVEYNMFGLGSNEIVNCFDLNIDGDTCYLLHINLSKSLRGNGNGKELYESIEEFSRVEGLRRVVMFPSGTTFCGDSRRNYVHRIGYRDITPNGEVEKILRHN
jgi:GNAT superfamily N-acetyltransferase